MKKSLLFFLCIGLFCIRCKKETQSNSDPLIGKWQFYLDGITRMGADACQHKTQPDELYFQPSGAPCVRDNVWEFSPNRITLYSGAAKCIPDEPTQVFHQYQRTDSTLTFNAKTYRIVMLSSDTLIIDGCQQLNVNIPGTPPAGPNFARLASKFYRLK